MNQKEQERLLEYLLNELIRLENDVVDCQNHVRWRKPDEVDCLECLLAITRLKAFREFSAAVTAILSLN